MSLFKRILAPVDGSRYSRDAVRVAAQIAVIHGAQLKIMHALDMLLADQLSRMSENNMDAVRTEMRHSRGGFPGRHGAGDPDGGFCAWTELVFTSTGSYISYMEFTDTAAQNYVIDNLTLQDPLNRNGFWAPPDQIGGAIAIDIPGDRLAVGW